MARKSPSLRMMGIAVAVLASLLLLSVVIASAWADRFARQALERARVGLEQKLQRRVQVGDVDVEPLRGRMRIDDIEIGPAKGEPPGASALALKSLRVDLSVWRTAASLGRRPYVETIDVALPRVTVVKRVDGSLNWGEISARLEEKQRHDARTGHGRPPKVRIGRAELSDGSVHFMETGRDGRTADISSVGAVLENAEWGEGGDLALEAALLQPRRNLRLEARLSGSGEAAFPAALETLEVELEPTSLAPLVPFLASLGSPESMPEQGSLSASLDFDRTEKGGSKGIGHVLLAGARFPRGEPFDGRVDFDLSTGRGGERIVVRQLIVALGGMKLSARGLLTNLKKTPRTEDVAVSSENLDFDRLAALYPPFDALTDPLVLDGPFSIRASGGGTKAAQYTELTTNLSHASIRFEDKFHKPRGTPAVLRAKLRAERDLVTIERAVIELSSWQMTAAGRVRYHDGEVASYDLDLATPSSDAGGLLRLLPPVTAAIPDSRDIGGEVAVSAQLAGTPEKARAQGTLRLKGLDVRVPGARFGGGGGLTFDLNREGSELTGRVRAEMSDLEAIYLDVVNKPKGAPFDLDARWNRARNETHADFSAKVASLAVEGNATLRGEAPAQPFTAVVTVGPFSMRSLLALFPSATSAAVPDVRFGAMTIRTEGVTGRPAALNVEIPRFVANAGRSDLSGALRFSNLHNPLIAFEGRSSYLDLDDFMPSKAEKPEKAGKKAEKPRGEPSPLARADGRVTLRVEQGNAAGVAYRKLDAKLRLEEGKATAEVLEVDTLGGHFSGAGSRVPVFVDEGPYRLKGEAEAVHLEPLLARFAGTSELMSGVLTATFDLSAADTTPEALSRTLTGHLAGRVPKAEFLPASGFGALVARLEAVPGIGDFMRRPGARLETWQIHGLSGELAIVDGAVVIEEPLTAMTPQGALSVRGKLRLAGPADLVATLSVRPEALEQLIGEKLPFDQPLPIAFKVVGPLANPRFAFGDLTPLVQPILQAYVEKGIGVDLERQIRDAVGGYVGAPAERDDPKKPAPGRADNEKAPAKKPKKKPAEQQILEDELRRQLERLP